MSENLVEAFDGYRNDSGIGGSCPGCAVDAVGLMEWFQREDGSLGAGMTRPLKAHIFDRAADEWYVEPEWVSDALFRAEEFGDRIWDPACGQGNVLAAAMRAGKIVHGHDIVDRSSGRWGVRDFLGWRLCHWTMSLSIVTNPPFGRGKIAEAFIRHAHVLRPRKLAVFVDSRFLFGRARALGLFSEFSPARVWLITPRPSCPPGNYLRSGNKAGGGTKDYCWLVWDEPGFLNSDTTILEWMRRPMSVGANNGRSS
jgi:hypothetical protein